MNQGTLETQPNITIKKVEANDIDLLSKVAELEKQAYGDTLKVETLQQMILGGEVIIAVYSDNNFAGEAVALINADPHNSKKIVRELPAESLWAFGAAIVPKFRGKSLQKRLLEERLKLARENNKETVMGTVRLENGASMRNITNTGGHLLAFSPDFFPLTGNPTRLIWEIYTTLQNKSKEQIDNGEALTPQRALEALKKKQQKIILKVEDGNTRDFKAEEATAQILSEDYVGTYIQTLYVEEGTGTRCNGVVFKHLSTFPPDMAQRLRERKEKIQKLLEPDKEKLALKIEVAETPTIEVLKAIKYLRELAAEDPEDSFFLVTNPEKEKAITNEQRTQKMFGEGKFVLLSWNGSEAVGMSCAEKQEEKGEGVWYVGSVYVKPEFRGGFGKKFLAILFDEIRKKKGVKVTAAVKKRNLKMIHIFKKFGFKNFHENAPGWGTGLDTELDLTNQEVIDKINEVLNVG